jgi:hypothetical protein
MGINEAGSIFANSSNGGFLLRSPDGTSTSFRVPGSYITTATSINHSDVVPGLEEFRSFVDHITKLLLS